MTGRIEHKQQIETELKEKLKNYPSWVGEYYYSLTNNTHASKETYITRICVFLDHYFQDHEKGNESLRQVTGVDVNRFLDDMKNEHLRKTGKELAKTTIALQISCLASFFYFLVTQGYIPESPMIKAVKRPKSLQQKPIVYLEKNEIRKVLQNVVEYKLSGEIRLLRACESNPREAWENILKPSAEEHYMDLGAYTGDTIMEFIRYAGAWRRITALEPDSETFARLEKNTAALHDCILYRLGAYSRYARQPFAGGAGRGSHLAEDGVMTELDSVDNILCGQSVSLINMDVEGMEAEAIAGMVKTLRRDRPKLLLAAYHRSEDLWRLPLEVLAIQPGYKVYLRHHPCLPAWDVNYYFV